MPGFKQGYYICKNPDKYIGDVTKIFYRSSWEQYANAFFDGNPGVLQWSSEPVAIPYLCPHPHPDGGNKPFYKLRNYHPDYWIKIVTKTGEIRQLLIEIKPKAQSMRSRSRNKKTQMQENYVHAVNQAKWYAAKNACKQANMDFQVITEEDLFKFK